MEQITKMQTKFGSEVTTMVIQWVRDNCQDLIVFHRKTLEEMNRGELKIIDSKLTKLAKQIKEVFPFIKQPKVCINDVVDVIIKTE
jgi:hypothetical protein